MQQNHWRQLPMRAAIDIGSNTIHIVVARCKSDDLDIVEDQVDLVRIGESVTSSGEISAQKREEAIATLRHYKDLAEKHNAEPVLVVATEAIRQASNSNEFLEAVQRETGLTVHVISGTAEATLTFYGATYEEYKQPGAPAHLGVMDLGGGSMEFVAAKNTHISWRISIPIGSGWLHDRYLSSDPAAPADLSVARTFLQTYFQGMRFKQQPSRVIVTGGSANSLLHLARRTFLLDVSSNRLTYDDLVHCEGLMSALPAEEIAQRYEQPVARTRILPAGALIIQEVMSRLHLNEISVSPHGIREGVLLAYERYGKNWLNRVNEESSEASRSTGAIVKGQALQPDPREEVFIHSGQRMLKERMKKLLEWRDEVLKQEDIEAVHKMRVASRRLRATLDAYESCCKRGPFKNAYGRVKDMADILGSARDTDVMLQGLQAQHEQVPVEEQAGTQWLINRLDTYRQQRQQELEAFFETLDEQALQRQVELCIQQKGASSNGKS
jgi:exopolyphosphatase/pppGpp-phosphohydrolase